MLLAIAALLVEEQTMTASDIEIYKKTVNDNHNIEECEYCQIDTENKITI